MEKNFKKRIELLKYNDIDIDSKIEEQKLKVLKILINQYKGKKYERCVYKYLQDNNIECWLWRDVPLNILYESKYISLHEYNELKNNNIYHNNLLDKGVDIVAKYKTNFVFIQCKNFKTSISNKRLTTYFDIMKEHNYNLGLVFYSNKISKNITHELKNIDYINLPFSDDENDNSIKSKISKTINNKLCLYPSIRRVVCNEINKIKDDPNTKFIKTYQFTLSKDENPYFIRNINKNKFIYYLQEIEEFINIFNKLPSTDENINIYNLINCAKNSQLPEDLIIIWANFKEKYLHLF
jgi:hypothetical protein